MSEAIDGKWFRHDPWSKRSRFRPADTPAYADWLAAIIEDMGPEAAAAAIIHDPDGLIQFCKDLVDFVDPKRSPYDYEWDCGTRLKWAVNGGGRLSAPEWYVVRMTLFEPVAPKELGYEWPVRPWPAQSQPEPA